MQKKGQGYWIYGKHSVIAALKNRKRQNIELLISKETYKNIQDIVESANVKSLQMVTPQQLEQRVLKINKTSPSNITTHQGLLLYSMPLYEQIKTPPKSGLVLILDQVQDPHNIGAIIRSAAAFGASAVLTTRDGAPEENGTICKASAGQLEEIPYIRVVNLARSIKAMQDSGYSVIGLTADGRQDICEYEAHSKSVAVVLGNEGKGLRRLTLERCDDTAFIQMSKTSESLNVSNAAAIALYTVAQKLRNLH